MMRFLSTLFSFAAGVLLMHHALGTFQSAVTEGRNESNRLEFVHEDQKLPVIFKLRDFGVLFLPLINSLIRHDRFGLRGRSKELDLSLISAGLRPFLPPESLLSISFLLTFTCGLLMALLAIIFDFGSTGAGFGLISGGLAGMMIPQVMLNQLVVERIGLIEKRLPSAIEFMLLTMEANAAFPFAIAVYCEQFKNEPLADELQATLADLDKGVNLQEAFLNMEKRVGSEELSAFVMAIVTGSETGQPIREVLETQAATVRQRRYESAEVIAKKASTKATFPLFMIVIAILLLLLGPVVVNLSRSTLI